MDLGIRETKLMTYRFDQNAANSIELQLQKYRKYDYDWNENGQAGDYESSK